MLSNGPAQLLGSVLLLEMPDSNPRHALCSLHHVLIMYLYTIFKYLSVLAIDSSSILEIFIFRSIGSQDAKILKQRISEPPLSLPFKLNIYPYENK